jgi:carbon monoxide dehydrogenase subunit G/ketosteroid isomerase-like protein
MIEAEHAIVINKGIDEVWNYVKDIEKWANLFPGCQECHVINDDESKWVIKVGAGGLIKTVNVLVTVENWNGPGGVNFAFKLENEPVIGGGIYTARATGKQETEISMGVRVEGSGSMAPMWEAVSKPLLPQLAKSFASKLKSEIEETVTTAPTPVFQSIILAVVNWVKNIGWAVMGSKTERLTGAEEQRAQTESHKKQVLTFIEAMGKGDTATAATCLRPDATTVAKGYGKFSGVREYDTIVGTIGAFLSIFPKGLNPEIKAVMTDKDRVVVEFEGAGVTCRGEDYRNQYCMVFLMQDGKIKTVHEYFCNKLADEVLWPIVESMSEEIPAS